MENDGKSYHIDALDGLRGLASLTVVVSHFSNVTNLFDEALGRGAGQIGVMVFFMLSGFLMAHLYFHARPTGEEIKTFYVRRLARIAPLYLLAVILAFLSMTALEFDLNGYGVVRENLAAHLLFLEGRGVLWTIPIEVQFYVIFPVIWFGFSRFGERVAWALLPVVIATFVFPVRNAFGLIPYVQFFLIGIIIQMFHARLPRLPALTLPIVLVVYVAVFPKLLNLYGFALPNVDEIWTWLLHPAVVAALLLATLKSTLAPRILGNPAARWAGRVSFSAYLLHHPIIQAVVLLTPGLDVWLHLLISLVAVGTVSELSYRMIEWPARQYITGWRARRSAHLASEAAS